MVEILEIAVEEALPECRRRHPLPEPVPGHLLSDLVRDLARKIAVRESAYEGQSLRASEAPGHTVHLLTRDGSLRIRVRKMRDPDQPVPDLQLELDLFGEDGPGDEFLGDQPELALLWAVRGEALYRVVLACPAGFDDEASLRKWQGGAVELSLPAVRTLVSPLGGGPASADPAAEEDDLDDAVTPKPQPGSGRAGDAPAGA